MEISREAEDDFVDVETVDAPFAGQRHCGKCRETVTSKEEYLFMSLREKFLKERIRDDDEDKLFMLSLVPELKKVPEDLKFDVKSSLLSVFKRARFQPSSMSLPMQHFHPTSSQTHPCSMQYSHHSPQGVYPSVINMPATAKQQLIYANSQNRGLQHPLAGQHLSQCNQIQNNPIHLPVLTPSLPNSNHNSGSSDPSFADV